MTKREGMGEGLRRVTGTWESVRRVMYYWRVCEEGDKDRTWESVRRVAKGECEESNVLLESA